MGRFFLLCRKPNKKCLNFSSGLVDKRFEIYNQTHIRDMERIIMLEEDISFKEHGGLIFNFKLYP
jgi:hypothetical protein